MNISDSTIDVITRFVDSGEVVFVKCSDDSEAFICKFKDKYLLSDEREFKEDHTSSYSDINSIMEHFDSIRGYGLSKYEDGSPIQISRKCGCDS